MHNPFVAGDRKAYFGLVRIGKEFDDGNHRFNLMGTAVRRDENSFSASEDSRLLRNGYSSGMDFEMNFKDRMYRINGSAVGTMVDPFDDQLDPSLSAPNTYGTGGRASLRKAGGKWRGILLGGWESDRLDPNDMGFLRAPDEKFVMGEVSYNYDSDGQDKPFNRAEIELNFGSSWLYAGNSGLDINTRNEVWSYDRSHHQDTHTTLMVWSQHRTFHQGWAFISKHFDGTDKYATRHYEDDIGPLLTQPGWLNIGFGGTTDWRKPISLHAEFHGDWGDNLTGLATSMSLRWSQNSHLSHSFGFGVRHNISEAMWMGNVANDGTQPGVTGIGGVDYVFGELDQMIWDMTLRSNILFDRNKSLQIYLQPFLTYGDYTNPRWLATADSYDLRPYDVDASAYDFNYSALNLNIVYRWEYQPGSTFYLVWTHSKDRYDQRDFAADPDSWQNDFKPSFLVDSEPENTFLAKFSYWFSI